VSVIQFTYTGLPEFGKDRQWYILFYKEIIQMVKLYAAQEELSGYLQEAWPL
jgi:hypothetical protein